MATKEEPKKMEVEVKADQKEEKPKDTNVVRLFDGGIVKKILKEGQGTAVPPLDSEVTVTYIGRLLDGTVFDSSFTHGTPFKFNIGKGNVIRGWDEGVATMKKGEKAILTCLPQFAYGEAGSPPKIPFFELLSWSTRKKLTEDGGIQKEILTPASAENYAKPNDFGTAKVSIVGYILKNFEEVDEKNDVKYIENKELKVTLGVDVKAMEGLEEAIKSMAKGEKSRFYIHPHYAYGAQGNSSLKVPPNAALMLEIELLDLEKAKESWELSNEEKLERGRIKKEMGNEYFKAENLDKAMKKYNDVISLFAYERQFSDDQKKGLNALKVTCYSNLAICKYKQKLLSDCIHDCDEAIKVDHTHVKSLFRKALCLFEMHDDDGAMFIISEARKLDPKNKDVHVLYDKVHARIQAVKQKEKQLYGGLFQKVKLVGDNELPIKKVPAKKPEEKKDVKMDVHTTDKTEQKKEESKASAPTSVAATSSAPSTTTTTAPTKA